MQDTPRDDVAAPASTPAAGADAVAGAPAQTASSTPPAAAPMALRDWVREGLRAGVFLRPRLTAPEPSPLQLLAIVAATAALNLGLQRLAVDGPAEFSVRGWLTPWWSMAVAATLVWCVFRIPQRGAHADRPAAVAPWFALTFVAAVPLVLSTGLLWTGWARGWIPSEAFRQSAVLGWGVYVFFWAWYIGVATRIAAALGLRGPGLAILAAGLLATNLVSAWQFQDRAWYPSRPETGDDEPRLELSQDVFESQQALRDAALQALKPQRPGVVDVYGIVFAPYASEDVFLRESTMVSGVLRERFDAQDRVLQLVNNPSTTATLPWATTQNLQRAIEAVARTMDKDEDVLVVYLTSHGASNHVLAAEHWPLRVPGLKPEELRLALDRAGIRRRVVAVSACYSGGWIDPLATDDSLVMTAADATHTSYGCGRKSPLTFFGRAVFDEQLRRTHSFEDAFAAAVPVIRQREVEGKKADGFSNPQIRVGAGIRPALAGLARRLEGTQP